MPFFSKGALIMFAGFFVASATALPSKGDVNAKGVICGLEDGYDYGYSFNDEKVLYHTFVVTDDKILSNVNPQGSFTDKSDYIEWNVHFSNAFLNQSSGISA